MPKRTLIAAGGLLLALSAALAAAAPTPGPTTTVGPYHGISAFFIDGRPELRPGFESYVPSTAHYRQFAEAGCRVYGFPCNAAAESWEHSRPTWVGPEVWNYGELDEFAHKVLAADPDGLIMPRIHVAEPDWWRQQNPAELMVFDDGTSYMEKPFRLWPGLERRTYPTLASRKWREDLGRSLRLFIEHIEWSDYADHIFGYQVLGHNTEEWYHYDYGRPKMGGNSAPTRIAFQQWLKRKYWTTERLRAAWNDPTVDFHTAVAPSRAEREAGMGRRTFRDPQTQMDVIDFYQFWNEIVPETIDYFAGIVKDASNRQKVVGAFYAYLFEFAGRPDSGHLGVQKLLQSNNIDFIVVTASYWRRHLGAGGSILRSPHTSVELHGKLWFEDNDTVSFLFPEVAQRIGDAEWERSKVVLAATDTAEETKWIQQRHAGMCLGNGIHQNLFDLHGGYFDHPQIMADIADLYGVWERARQYDLDSCSEVLVLADELSNMYCTMNSPLLDTTMFDPPYRLIKAGFPYDAIYVSDLDRIDPGPYKLAIVLNAFHLDARQRALINHKLKRDGRTILWIYTPGLFDGTQEDMDWVRDLTQIALRRDADGDFVKPRIKLDDASGYLGPAAAGLDVVGPDRPCYPMVQVVDDRAVVVGRHAGGREVVLAAKSCDGWTSVYAITSSLPPALWRALAQAAGVHVYNDRDDTLYVSRSYLTVNADGAGSRELRFPVPVTLYDAVTEARLAGGVTKYTLPMRDKETRMIRIAR